MNSIVFSGLKKSVGLIVCKYEDSKNSGDLYFELNMAVSPSNDLIAISLSTLCGRGNYQSIKFDFDISNQAAERIKDFCRAEIACGIHSKSSIEQNVLTKNKSALSFSGGFDSLAAKFLMPDDTVLISMDFGGKFAREREFFNEFDTHIVTTNLLETHLRANSWSFMGIAAILYSDYLSIKYHTFGGILEAGPSNFATTPVAAKNETFPPFAAVDMINAPYVLGITEIGTAMILMKYAPDLVKKSLDSLANAGEEKKYRKQIIASLVSGKMGIEFEIKQFDEPNHAWIFGKSFAVDFLAIYFLKFAGKEITEKMVKEIPYEIIELSQRLSLKFYERVNTNFLENFPPELLGGLLEKLSAAKIVPYTGKDWSEFNEVVAVLKKYYKI